MLLLVEVYKEINGLPFYFPFSLVDSNEGNCEAIVHERKNKKKEKKKERFYITINPPLTNCVPVLICSLGLFD